MSYDFQAQVTNKDGVTKNVMADSQEDLDQLVALTKEQTALVSVDINVPVKKGFDLVGQDENGAVLVDGTGVHNSPRDAVNDDGSVGGNADVPLLVPDPSALASNAVKQNVLVSDGNLNEAKPADVTAAAATPENVPTDNSAAVVPSAD